MSTRNPLPTERGRQMTEPSDEDIRAYLEGEHGPPSAEAVAIIQDNLERAVRHQPSHTRIAAGACSCGATYSWAPATWDEWWTEHVEEDTSGDDR